MEKNPETHLAHGATATSTHVFRIAKQNMGELCANCHGQGVNGEGFQASVEGMLAQLGTSMGQAVLTKIAAAPYSGVFQVTAWDPAADQYTAGPVLVDSTQNAIKSIQVSEIHGQIGFLLTFTNPIARTFIDANKNPQPARSLSTVGVQLGALVDTQVTPVALFTLGSKNVARGGNGYVPTANLVNAGWNYFLIEGDSTAGIHNPSFAVAVLQNTLAQDLTK
jgi:hypothetical protein